MKILIIGFLAFLGWSTLSSYIYVCKINGLCDESTTIQVREVRNNDIVVSDTIHKPLASDQATIPENLVIYFAFDKSEFNSNKEADKYYDESNAFLNQNIQARLSITGHTDAVGSNEYNQALGFRRAQTMQHYFESKGIQENKIIIESKGEKDPADNNNTTAGRTNNRRTSITIKN